MSCDVPELADLLAGLTAEEQAIIRPVLERDLEFQRREKQRLRNLRTSVDLYKSESLANRSSSYSMPTSESQESMNSFNSNISSASPSSPSYRSCVRCSTKLGFILNSGSKCRKCQLLVCDACRVFTTPAKQNWLCPLCFKERELQAASGEWIPSNEIGDSTNVSQQLLTTIRATKERNHSVCTQRHVRAPPISRRNMTLPSLGPMTLLSVPTEAEAVGTNRAAVTRRYWGGSPSPRSPSPRPLSAGPNGIVVMAPTPPPHQLIAEIHPREVIGSPAPRSGPPVPYTRNSVLPSPTHHHNQRQSISGPHIQPPVTEIAPPTPTSPSPSARRQVFSSHKSSNLLRPIDMREQRRSSSPFHPNHDEHQEARNHPSTRPSTPNRLMPTAIKASSTGQVPQMGKRPRPLPPQATSDPQLNWDPLNEWEPYRKGSVAPSLAQSRQGSQGSVASYRSVQSSASDNRLDAENNNQPRRRSNASRQMTSPMTSSRGRGSRDTDTFSMGSCGRIDKQPGVNVASQFSNPPRFLGEIQLSLDYDALTGSLQVHIIRCRSLPHFGNHRPNPYVKVFLLGEYMDGAVLKHKTSARRAAIDPQFDELMKFPSLSISSLEERSLMIAVWHKDALGHNALIGEAVVRLRDVILTSSPPIWLPLEAKAVASSGVSVPPSGLDPPVLRRDGPREEDRHAARPPHARAASGGNGTHRRAQGEVAVQRPPPTQPSQSLDGRFGGSAMGGRIPTTMHPRHAPQKREDPDQGADWTLWI